MGCNGNREAIKVEEDSKHHYPFLLYGHRSVSLLARSTVLSADGCHRQRSEIKLTWREYIPVVYEKWARKTRYFYFYFLALSYHTCMFGLYFIGKPVHLDEDWHRTISTNVGCLCGHKIRLVYEHAETYEWI